MTTPILPPPLRDAGPLETMATPLIEAIALVLRDADHGCDWEAYVADAQAALTAITTAGYAVVPVEPTGAMVEAGNATDMIDVPDCDPPVDLPDTWAIYRAMIAAAPPLNTKEGE